MSLNVKTIPPRIGFYLAGFADGEGSFNVSFRPRNDYSLPWKISLCFNISQKDNWGFVRLCDAEFRYLARQVADMAIPELVLLAEIDNQPVGFSITLPDWNEAIRPLNGRLTTWGLPLGLLRLPCRKRCIKTARMLVLDVVEEYRRRGISELLILQTLDYGKNTIGFTGAELGWTLEDKYLVNRTIEAVGARHYKTHRIYQKSLD